MIVLLVSRNLVNSARSTFFRLVCLCVIALTLLAVPYSAHAQAPHIIDFENLQPTTVVNQYSTTGVTFNSPALRDFASRPGFAHSGTKAIELCYAVELCTTPLNVNFAAAQTRIKVWIGISYAPSEAKTVILKVLDQNGTVIGQSSALVPASAGPVPVQIPLEYTSASANVRQAVVTFGQNPDGSSSNAGLVVDDVEFTTAGTTPCTSTVRPTLTLEKPTDNEAVSTNQFLIKGTAAGASPFVEATVTVANSTGTRSSDVLGRLIQSGGGPFSTNFAGALAPGENTVTVSVRDCRFTVPSASRKVLFNEIGSGARIKFLGLEVVQATQDRQNSVPLIANKTTLVRVYLNVVGSPGAIAGVTGSLTATPPGQQVPIPPLLHSMNTVTLTDSESIGVQRLDLTKSLNFALPPEWTAGRTLHFALGKFSVQGSDVNLPCDGCDNLDLIGAPLWSHFQATKPINIVLAPYIYERDGNRFTPDLLFSLSGALAWMNNTYPVSGDYPVDQSGIRILSVLPVGTTSRDLSRRSDDGGEFLDLLQTYRSQLAVLNEGVWPSDFHILALTPCDCPGRARRGGWVAFADIASPQIPSSLGASKFGVYGSTIAHELAHNLGRMHAGNSHGEDTSGFWEEFWQLLTNTDDTDYDFPNPHGGIGEPGIALTTLHWKPGPLPFLIAPGMPAYAQTHAHDFMSYGGGSEWISPYTYKALYDKRKITAQAMMAQPTPIEKVIVEGRIYVDRSVKFRPFIRAVTALQSEAGTPSEYTLALVDANGRTLIAQPVATARVADVNKKAPPYLSFSEIIPWRSGTKEIVLSDRAGVRARRSVSANAPRMTIGQPVGGGRLSKSSTVSWTASDADGDMLTYSVFYSPGRNAAWVPLADGLTDTTLSFDTGNLPGGRDARLRVIATDGVNSATVEVVRLLVEDKAPEVGIQSASGENTFAKGSPIQLLGGAIDIEDGVLDAKRLQWSSGGRKLGAGHRLVLSDLGIGQHVIELKATDASGRSASAKFELQVR